MKLHLQSLRVVNCGPLKDVCVHFSEGDVTVLAGANGSGKTTILELIAGVWENLSNPKAKTGRTISKAEYIQADWLIDGTPYTIYRGEKIHETMIAPESVGWSPASLWAADYSGTMTHWLREMMAQQDKMSITDLSREIQSCLPTLLFFSHTRSLNFVSGAQIQREETLYQPIYRYHSSTRFRESLDSYLVWLDYAEPETYGSMIDFLNGLDFDGKTFGIVRKELRAVVTTKDGQTHGVSELSSGEQNILIMLLELRRRLLPGSIVLIDEIENSLHPAFQYRIAEGLKKLQQTVPFQLIVTTHSPIFVDIFGTQNTRILTEF